MKLVYLFLVLFVSITHTSFSQIELRSNYFEEGFDNDIPEGWITHIDQENLDYIYWFEGRVIIFRQSGVESDLVFVSPRINLKENNGGKAIFTIGEQFGDPTMGFGLMSDPADPSSKMEILSYSPTEDWEDVEVDLSSVGDVEEGYLYWSIENREFSYFSFDKVIITEGELSANKEENARDIVVAPNPVQDILQLSIPYEGVLEIHDAMGQSYLKQTVKQGKHLISTQDWIAGGYFLRYQSENGLLQTWPFVKLNY